MLRFTVDSQLKNAVSPPAVAYRYSLQEKLRLFLPAIRQRIRPKRNLLAGPFAGEFGWELMQWQGFVRSRRPYYENVHVLSYPGRAYLYEDCEVHEHSISLKDAGYGYGLLRPNQAEQVAHAKAAQIGLRDYDVFNTSLLCTRYHKAIWGQKFRLFEELPLTSSPYDVVFHFRAVQKQGPDKDKNYHPALADELARLCADQGLSLGCIGHPEYSHCPVTCTDHRSIDLRRTVAAISSARAVAGENSGPMHLANLCGKPTVIWAQDQWRIDYSLRWNPFRVPIYIATNVSCQPPPSTVCQTIIESLEDIRKRTNGFRFPAYQLPAQRVAPY